MPPRPSRSGALVATAQRARAPDARSASCRSPPRPGGPDVAVGPCRAPRPPGTVQRRSALPLAQEPGAGVSTSGLAAPQDDASCSFQARTPCVTGRAGTSLPTRLLALYRVVDFIYQYDAGSVLDVLAGPMEEFFLDWLMRKVMVKPPDTRSGRLPCVCSIAFYRKRAISTTTWSRF
jgi:hypothetical protein